MFPIVPTVQKIVKTEEIKVRLEPSKKRALEEIAQREQLDLSDIARRAFKELIERDSSKRAT